MNNIPEDQDLEVVSLVEKLLIVPERSPRAAADGRANFLAEARLLQPAISRTAERRHIEWKSVFSGKAKLTMATISTLLAILTMLFGGAGAAVYAAQGSLPGQALYPLKLASEEVRTGLAGNNPTRMHLMMDFADLRLQEASQLAAQGKSVPGMVWDGMDGRYATALQMAAGLNDGQLRQELPQIHERIATDISALAELSNDPRYRDDASKIQAALQSDLQLVSSGMMDPGSFRQYMGMHQYPNNWQSGPPTGSVTPAPTMRRNMMPAWGTATPWPYNNWNDRWNNGQQDNCQGWDDCGRYHDGGGWGGGGRGHGGMGH